MPASPRSAEAMAAQADAVLARLPPRLRGRLVWLLSRWPGRIALRSATTSIRLELFDRSMTIAAQVFTSVFPILILTATRVSASNAEAFADAVDMPEESESILVDAAQGSSTAWGVTGTLIVLVSATSLSRALTRAYAAIWNLPRPKSGLGNAWRWLAVVIGLALAVIITRALSGQAADVPPRNVWQLAVSLFCDLGVAVFVPWLLLTGAVPLRRLVPGAALFALVMLVVRPASSAWLPRALETSADRYGSIGVAFTYLAWLYVVSFCFLTAAVIGRVVATDSGWVGARIRGPSTPETDDPDEPPAPSDGSTPHPRRVT